MTDDYLLDLPVSDEITEPRPPRIIFQDKSKKKISVAAYCRVSTDHEDQDGSITMQREHYERVIKEHPDWELAGVYFERISGTRMDTRVQLNMLLEECKNGHVDLVLTKSISRFSRNTTDLLWMVRTLTSMGTGIFFEKENIDTRSGDGELLITLLASYAEEESRSISENNKWAIRKRFESGQYKYANAPYGYDIKDGCLLVNEREAEIVRYIYEEYLKGKGVHRIASDLNDQNIPPKKVDKKWVKREHSGKWSASTISSMLQNEMYIGNCLWQKYYHDSDYHLRLNQGELPKYYIESHHEAIIDKEIFEKVKCLMDQKRKEFRLGGKRMKHTFSGKCICGLCGSVLIRENNTRSRKKDVTWVCSFHRKNAENCSLKPVYENDIRNAFITLFNKLHYSDIILDIYIKEMEERWRKEYSNELNELESKIKKNNQRMERLAMIKGNYPSFFERKKRLISENRKLTEKMESIRRPDTSEMLRLKQYVEKWDGKHFAEQAFTDYIHHVMIQSPQEFTFYFKCGLILSEGR